MKLQYISTDKHIADNLTKPLARKKFVYFKNKVGMILDVSLPKMCWCFYSIEQTFSHGIMLT